MATAQYLNKTGLSYFYGRLKTIFASKSELDGKVDKVVGKGLSTNDLTDEMVTEIGKIDGLVTQGGEPNKIEAIQMGYATEPLIITNKKVVIPAVYTDRGEDGNIGNTYNSLIDESGNTLFRFVDTDNGISVGLGTGYSGGGVTKELVDKDYVDNNAGKIDKIKVNGTDVYIDAQKSVDIGPALTYFNWSSSFNQIGSYIALTGPEKNAALPTLRFTKTANGVQIYGEHDTGMQAGLGGIEVTDKSYVDNTIDDKIADALASISEIDFIIVNELPTVGEKGKFYLLANSGAESNSYDEYVWVNKGTTESPNYAFEKIGTTTVDLSGYLQSSDIEAITTAEIDEITAS